MADLCHFCRRPLTECRVAVDPDTWPARAVEAYARAELVEAATCEAGEAFDIRHTGGWCWSRIRRDKYWKGEPLTEAEQRGVGFSFEEQERRVRA